MLRLQIRFEGSWVNSFSDEHDRPRFTSGQQLTPPSGLTPIGLDPDMLGKPGVRLAWVQTLQRENPQLAYRVPENFESTAAGTLARLVGEVRRLAVVRRDDPDHVALRAMAKGKWSVRCESERSETISLATRKANDIQGGGAGLVVDRALYEDPQVGRMLFGHLDVTFEAMVDALRVGRLPEGNWRPASPGRLCERLSALEADQKAWLKSMRDENDAASPFDGLVGAFGPALVDRAEQRRVALNEETRDKDPEAPESTLGTVLERWSLAGAVAIARLHGLNDNERGDLVARNVLNKSFGIAGITMAGKGIGRVTPKDVFTAATGVRAKSYRVPCAVDLPLDIGAKGSISVRTGVIIHDGTLVFELTGERELEEELYRRIEAAAVGPFHFGKKGLARITQIVRRPDPEVSGV